MSLFQISSRISVLVALAIVVGCSQDDPNRGEVKGMVLVDGQPTASGSISFSPIDGNAPSSGGKIKDGQFSVKAATGTVKVAIRAPKVVGERKLYPTADSPVRKIMKESLPQKYNDNTTLTFEVKPGVTEHTFDLKTTN